MTLRAARIAREWDLLVRFAQDNPRALSAPERLSFDQSDAFRLSLSGVEALARPDAEERRTQHVATFRFPRFYPGSPIEGFLAEPVFHPNVDPGNGFVCLWKRTQVGDTVVEAVRRLRLILCWRAYNLETDHIMQPDAASRARTGDVPRLACPDLHGLPAPAGGPTARRRLTPLP